MYDMNLWKLIGTFPAKQVVGKYYSFEYIIDNDILLSSLNNIEAGEFHQ